MIKKQMTSQLIAMKNLNLAEVHITLRRLETVRSVSVSLGGVRRDVVGWGVGCLCRGRGGRKRLCIV